MLVLIFRFVLISLFFENNDLRDVVVLRLFIFEHYFCSVLINILVFHTANVNKKYVVIPTFYQR